VYIDTSPLSDTSDLTLPATIHAAESKPSTSGAVDGEGGDFAVVDPDGNGDYTTIQGAIDGVSGSTIVVNDGTYTEEVTVDKSVTIQAASGATPTIESPDGVGTTITVTADSVTIDGFEIKNSVGANTGFSFNQAISTEKGSISDLTIQNNEFRDIGSGSGARGNSEAIALQPTDGAVADNIRILDNVFENIVGRVNPETSYPNRTPKAIYVSTNPGGKDDPSLVGTAQNIAIKRNEIHNVEGPVGAYGIQLHYKVQGATIAKNDIYDIRGDPTDSTDLSYEGDDWAAAIQLSKGGGSAGGPLENVAIRKNYLSAVSDPELPAELSDDEKDDFATPGFALEVAGYADPATVTLRDNSIEAAGGLINKNGSGFTTADGTTVSGGAVDAKQNWWGDASGPSSVSADPNAPYDSAGGGATADGSGALVVDFGSTKGSDSGDDGVAEVNFDNLLTSQPVSDP
jgi:hypothetical protein